jgi:heme-degrading monooxygenase HmoA
MFARKVSARLHVDCLGKFTKLVEGAVVPWLRNQEGFRELIILASDDGKEVTTISFWDHAADAEAYNVTGYPRVLQALAQLLDGVPSVKMFDVVSSTFSSIAQQRPVTGSLVHGPESVTCDYRIHETSA